VPFLKSASLVCVQCDVPTARAVEVKATSRKAVSIRMEILIWSLLPVLREKVRMRVISNC
jgi:hypothetical protein